MDLDTAVQISVAALGVGIAPIVRVPAGQFWLATRVLDGGALGIVMPHVDTADEAREIADRLRYPPQGHRSVAGGLPHFGYVPIGTGAACAAINAATLVIVMLETPKAISNAAAIAAVSGIDSLLVGTSATLAVVPALMKNPGYDPVKSFAPVEEGDALLFEDGYKVLLPKPSGHVFGFEMRVWRKGLPYSATLVTKRGQNYPISLR